MLKEAIKEFGLNLTTVLISITDGTKDAFLDIITLGYPPGNFPELMIKDSGGDIVDSGLLVYEPYGQIEIDTGGSEILWIYLAYADFNDGNFISQDEAVKPEIKSIRVKEEVFEERVANVSRDFESFKQNINFPEGSDFGFDFVLSNGTIISAGENVLSGDVFVKEFPVTYIDKNASKLVGELRVRVW